MAHTGMRIETLIQQQNLSMATAKSKVYTYLTWSTKAHIPAASGALAEVPVCDSVQPLRKSVVTFTVWTHTKLNLHNSLQWPLLFQRFDTLAGWLEGHLKVKINHAPQECIGRCSSSTSRPWARRWRTTNVWRVAYVTPDLQLPSQPQG